MPPLAGAAPKVTVEWLIKPQFYYANEFSCGVAWVQEECGGTWKQIDRNGNVLIDNYEAESIFRYDEETKYAPFTNDQGLDGYIDLSGDIAITPQYWLSRSFKDGVAIVLQKDGDSSRSGVIDRNGTTVFPAIYESIIIINSNLFALQQGDKWGYVDAKGNVIADYLFDQPPAWISSTGIFPAILNGKVGLLDMDGKWVVSTSFDHLYGIQEGLIGLEKDGKVGFVDVTGKDVIDFQFEGRSGRGRDSYYTFSEGLAIAIFTKLPAPPAPKDITIEEAFAGTFWGYVVEDVQSGVINKNGTLLFRFQGMPLTHFTEGLLLIQNSEDTYGLIDREGVFYPLPPNIEFKTSRPVGLSERVLCVREKKKQGLQERGKYGYLTINAELRRY